MHQLPNGSGVDEMWFTVLFVCALLFLFYIYNSRNNGYWTKRKVQHETPKFFWGNFWDIMTGRKHFGVLFSDLYKKFSDASYIGYFKLGQPAIILRDPELIRNILVKDFQYFANNDFEVDKHLDPILCENLFIQTGEEWKKNRSQWSAGLTSSKLKAMYEQVNQKCDVMLDYIKKCNEEKKSPPFDVKMLSSRFFTDVIVNSVFGLKINSFDTKDGDNVYFKITNSFFVPSFWEGMKTLLYTLAPGLVSIFKLKFVSKETENELVIIAQKILESRKHTDLQKNNPFDSILYNDYKANIPISRNRVAGLVFNFLIDATETSAGVAGFILYAIAANPHIQQKLREEIKNVDKNENGNIPYEEIHAMPYMEMVFAETMRLYPPALSLQRICTKEYTLPPSYPGSEPLKVELGTPVTVPIYGLHMDPQYFPNPDKFDPERFNEENKRNITKFTNLPFGEGPRICIGFRFAANQIKCQIAGILKRYEIRLAPQMVGKPIKIDPSIFVYRNIGGLWLTFHELKE